MDILDNQGEMCLFANRDYEPEEKVLDIFLSEKSTQHETRDKYTIELNPNMHLMHPVGRYINHHCNPTMRFDKRDGAFYAKVYIDSGDELTFNYMENETKINSPFKCRCGASDCIKLVK